MNWDKISQWLMEMRRVKGGVVRGVRISQDRDSLMCVKAIPVLVGSCPLDSIFFSMGIVYMGLCVCWGGWSGLVWFPIGLVDESEWW